MATNSGRGLKNASGQLPQMPDSLGDSMDEFEQSALSRTTHERMLNCLSQLKQEVALLGLCAQSLATCLASLAVLDAQRELGRTMIARCGLSND